MPLLEAARLRVQGGSTPRSHAQEIASNTTFLLLMGLFVRGGANVKASDIAYGCCRSR